MNTKIYLTLLLRCCLSILVASISLIANSQKTQQNAKAGTLIFKNHYYLARGPFDLIAVLDESISA